MLHPSLSEQIGAVIAKDRAEHLRIVRGSVCYFMQAQNEAALIKIGRSSRLATRQRDIERQIKCPLKLLGTMKGHDRHERTIQKMFAQYRVKGEWFTPAAELIAFIEMNKSTPVIAEPRRITRGQKIELRLQKIIEGMDFGKSETHQLPLPLDLPKAA